MDQAEHTRIIHARRAGIDLVRAIYLRKTHYANPDRDTRSSQESGVPIWAGGCEIPRSR